MSDLYWLTDEQMARLEAYFPRSGCAGDKAGHRNAGAVLSVAE